MATPELRFVQVAVSKVRTMNVNVTELRHGQGALEPGVGRHEARSPNWGNMNHDYGRRIEANRSWTVYHVFSGVPAELANQSMSGLSEADATAKMLFLNAHNAKRRKAALSR
jgi:hypothetical protein